MPGTITYTVDSADTITRVEGGWDTFVAANNGHSFAASVIGREIWDFVGVEEVVGLYRKLFDAVRLRQRSVTIHFRCDSERVLRFMTMMISPDESGTVTVKTELIREIERRQVLKREIIYMGIQGGTRMCSHCNKIYVPSVEQWMEIDYALALGYITGALNVNFKICDSCIGLFHQKIAAMG